MRTQGSHIKHESAGKAGIKKSLWPAQGSDCNTGLLPHTRHCVCPGKSSSNPRQASSTCNHAQQNEGLMGHAAKWEPESIQPQIPSDTAGCFPAAKGNFNKELCQ